MKNQTRMSWWLAVLFVLACVGQAVAQKPGGAIQLGVTAEKEIVVTTADGKTETKRVPAAKVLPKDKVVYTITYTNTGEEEAEQVFITNPVPEHMHYVAGTATGDAAVVTFSVDGGNVFDVPEKLTVKAADGTVRKATARDYTHIRWTLKDNVAAKTAGEVSFWAQLD